MNILSQSSDLERESGFALVLVLWIMAALFLMAGEYAFQMRTEVILARSHQEEQKVYFLAMSGFLAGMEEISRPSDFQYLADDGREIVFHRSGNDGGFPGIAEEADTSEGQPGGRKDLSLGDGYYFYSIRDQGGLINLNSVSEEELKRILGKCGMQIGSDMDMVAQSILDWRDEDDNHRIAGVEDDYYTSLPNPYHCKNGPFDTVEELRMVRGVTDELFLGNPEEGIPGLRDFFTVLGRRINKNTASGDVLEVKYGKESADDIISRRQEDPFVGNEGRSTVFEIVSRGRLDKSPASRTIKAVLRKRGPSFQVVRWYDNYFGDDIPHNDRETNDIN